MIKAPIDLQDLRRRLYVKAKAEPSWRFWGLYVHVCKMETLREAYRLAKENHGAPGIDGVTFEAIEAQLDPVAAAPQASGREVAHDVAPEGVVVLLAVGVAPAPGLVDADPQHAHAALAAVHEIDGVVGNADKDDVDSSQGPPRIEQVLKNRQAILCQVTKNPIAHKGARLTQEVSLPGRFVVLIPNSSTRSAMRSRMSTFSNRNRLAFSRPCPILWSSKEYQAPLFSTISSETPMSRMSPSLEMPCP